jgi:hypothetical protein
MGVHNENLMKLDNDLVGFYRDLMAYEWDIPSGYLT